MAASEFSSEKITEINLWVDSHPHPWVMNGTCTVKDWDRSGPVANGTFVRDTPLCKWNAWQSSGTWEHVVKEHGRK
jgi:hypothetical protein